VALAECGTHAIFDADVGSYATEENTLAGELIERLETRDAVARRSLVLRVPVVAAGAGDRSRLVVAGQGKDCDRSHFAIRTPQARPVSRRYRRAITIAAMPEHHRCVSAFLRL
jgi:hypothetical protein